MGFLFRRKHMNNTILNGDFKFLCGLFDKFFSQAKIKKQLNIIDETNITGWEVWFQVELALFLNECDNVPIWMREVPCMTDKRRNKIKNKGIIDFYLREKNKSTNKMIALELKQIKSIKSCITAMNKDIDKFNSLKQKERVFVRSFWCVGIHQSIGEQINDIRNSYEFKQPHLLSKEIKKTKFSYTIFSYIEK